MMTRGDRMKIILQGKPDNAGEPLDTYPVANVSAPVRHGWTAVAPTATPTTRSAPWASPVGAGTGAWVVSARTPVGARSVDGHTFNSTCTKCNKFVYGWWFLLKTTYLTWILTWTENETWTSNVGSHLWSWRVSYLRSLLIPVAWNPERPDA